MRNALAHANIYYLPYDDSDEIEYLVFLSKKRTKIPKELKTASIDGLKDFDNDNDAVKYLKEIINRATRDDERCAYLMTSPESFREFLGQWAKLIENIGIQPIDLREIYGEAAD